MSLFPESRISVLQLQHNKIWTFHYHDHLYNLCNTVTHVFQINWRGVLAQISIDSGSMAQMLSVNVLVRSYNCNCLAMVDNGMLQQRVVWLKPWQQNVCLLKTVKNVHVLVHCGMRNRNVWCFLWSQCMYNVYLYDFRVVYYVYHIAIGRDKGELIWNRSSPTAW